MSFGIRSQWAEWTERDGTSQEQQILGLGWKVGRVLWGLEVREMG